MIRYDDDVVCYDDMRYMMIPHVTMVCMYEMSCHVAL